MKKNKNIDIHLNKKIILLKKEINELKSFILEITHREIELNKIMKSRFDFEGGGRNEKKEHKKNRANKKNRWRITVTKMLYNLFLSSKIYSY